jgi:RNA polymerase sigma-70 factor (ECF subfamily)
LESDKDLIARLTRRDGRALESLMERLGPRLRLHLDGIVRDQAVVEDLLQELWLRLWEKASQWSGKGSLPGYLTRIATNLALNHLRSRRRSRECPLELTPPDAEEADADLAPGWMVDVAALGPDEQAARHERYAMLQGLVDALPESTQEMLRMIHHEQMDLAQTAEALGIPLGTVKSRLHYTHRRLGRDWPARED